MQIKELQPRTGNVNVNVTVIELSEPREFEKFGKAGKVCNAKVKDDSGEVTLTLWNEDVDKVKVGDTLKIENGWVSEWQGELQLSTGRFGKLEVVSGNAKDSESKDSKEPASKTNKVEEEEIQ